MSQDLSSLWRETAACRAHTLPSCCPVWDMLLWVVEVLRAFQCSPKLYETLQCREPCRHMTEILCCCPRPVPGNNTGHCFGHV